MKKILIMLTIIATCFGITGCINEKESDEPSSVIKKQTDEPSSVIKKQAVADLIKMSDEIHSKVEKKPFVEATEIKKDNKEAFTAATGLKSSENVEMAIMTEAMIGSQAYSFVLLKVTKGADIEKMKKEMISNIDLKKWICISADKAYVNNSKDLIMLVMGDTKIVDIDAIYKEFAKTAGNNLGKKLEKTGQN